MGKTSLVVSCATLREVVLDRKGSSKDVVLAVHRLNQVLAKARTFTECETLVTTALVKEEANTNSEDRALDTKSADFLQILIDVVVSGKPEAYPILCLLSTIALFSASSYWLSRLQVPLILRAVTKGSLEQPSADMATKILNTMEKQHS